MRFSRPRNLRHVTCSELASPLHPCRSSSTSNTSRGRHQSNVRAAVCWMPSFHLFPAAEHDMSCRAQASKLDALRTLQGPSLASSGQPSQAPCKEGRVKPRSKPQGLTANWPGNKHWASTIKYQNNHQCNALALNCTSRDFLRLPHPSNLPASCSGSVSDSLRSNPKFPSVRTPAVGAACLCHAPE